jgi:ribosomal protein S18 acetylase RimI-like enzyme
VNLLSGAPESSCDPSEHPLDNPVWWALGSHHAPLAETRGRARRYRPDVSLFAGVAGVDDESWADLHALVGPEGVCLLALEGIPRLPPGWTERLRIPGVQLTLAADRRPGVAPVGSRPLGDDDVARMLDLVALTEPGPFLPRTIEMGSYVGVFDGDELVAMAGERLHPEGRSEISAVCTHPRVRGRGLAAGLIDHVATRIIERDELPFLHVAVENANALRLYGHLGFTRRRSVEFMVLAAPAA